MAKKKRAARYSIAFEEAAEALGVKLDARGLVPLAVARKAVRKVKRVERDGNPDSDTLWAALLSLQDGAEFSRTVVPVELEGREFRSLGVGRSRCAAACRREEAWHA